MRSEIDKLIAAKHGTFSVAWAMQVLRIAAQIAAAVAAGLLAAAASAVSARAAIAPELLSAAVGAVVTSVCDRLGEAVRNALRSRAPCARLQAAHKDLTCMLEDLTGFVRRLGATSPSQDHDRALVRDTVLTATVTAVYAEALAKNLVWTGADDYTSELGYLRGILAEARQAAATGTRPAT
jgi:hypothetical protein